MNAAVDLAEIFKEWMGTPAHSVYDSRGVASSQGQKLDFWLEYQRVIELIMDLDYALDVLDRKGKSRERYDSLMVRIWRYAVLPDHGWHTANNVSISMDDIYHLETLGDVIETHVPQANKITDGGREIVLGLLDEARTAALDCFDLPEKIRTRLADLIEQLGLLLDSDRDSNPRTVQRTLDEMTSILLRAVWAEQKPDKKFKLFNLAFRFAQTNVESGSYDVIKAIAGTSVKDMLGLPTGEGN